MSPNINSFVGDLVEMAKAFEELPGVRRELDESRKLHSETLDHTATLEQRILNYKAEIEELNSRIRKVEAERDSAETMFLEADERANKATGFLGEAMHSLATIKDLIDPPKPEPIPEPEPIPAFIESRAEQGQSAERPTDTASSTTTSSSSNAPTPNADTPAPADTSTSSGQSDPLPTASSTIESSPSVPSTAENTADAEVAANPGPYSGKRYWYETTWISKTEWLDGGGSVEDYNWRPDTDRSYYPA